MLKILPDATTWPDRLATQRAAFDNVLADLDALAAALAERADHRVNHARARKVYDNAHRAKGQ